MTALLKLADTIDWLNQQVGRIVYWLGLVMILFGAYNASARYLGGFLGRNLSSNAYLDIQWYLFGVMFLVGAGYGLRHNVHVRVDVFSNRLSKRTQLWIELGGMLLVLLPFCALSLWFSLDWVAISWRIKEASGNPGGLPRYPIKAMIPLGFGLLFLQGVSQAIKVVAVLTGRRERLHDHHPEEAKI